VSSDNEDEKGEQKKRNCFKCGLSDHLSKDYQTKMTKIFQMRWMWISLIKMHYTIKTINDSNIVMWNTHKKYVKELLIKCWSKDRSAYWYRLLKRYLFNMQYIRVSIPKLEKNTSRFRGVASGDNVTLGEFDAIMTMDNGDYPIRIRVVSDTLMKHELFIDADFLDIVQITMNAGRVIINALKPVPEDKEVREM